MAATPADVDFCPYCGSEVNSDDGYWERNTNPDWVITCISCGENFSVKNKYQGPFKLSDRQS